jgi:putative ABC transport system ATP-binding protein
MTMPTPTEARLDVPVAARANDVWKVYGSGEAQVVALRGVSVDLGKAEFTAIMGPSGSGSRR